MVLANGQSFTHQRPQRQDADKPFPTDQAKPTVTADLDARESLWHLELLMRPA